jgi:hypothetical protein|tara:strand:- start:89 stop:370 length:282 start_codon:yes stop_codon:yes gene_type:complete
MDSAWASGEEEKRLCIVEWKDIISCSGWEKASDVQCPSFKTVGWFISDEEETIKIASTLDFDDFTDEAKGEAMPIPYGITAFPKGCVVNVTYV